MRVEKVNLEGRIACQRNDVVNLLFVAVCFARLSVTVKIERNRLSLDCVWLVFS